MSDPIPKGGENEPQETESQKSQESQAGSENEQLAHRPPPENFPEELMQSRIGRLDTRKALASLCKNIPGLDEVLLPPGIQADALTRKSGGSERTLRGVARRALNDDTAWGAFRTAVADQLPPETFEAVGELSPENLDELSRAHSTESLLFAAVSGEEEPDPEVVGLLIERWREENQQAEKEATENARLKEIEEQLEKVKKENQQLSFSSKTANDNAAALREELEVLRGERDEALSRAKTTEERAASALDERERTRKQISDLEKREAHLERVLKSERDAYSAAAARVDEMHRELEEVGAERDRIQSALQNARFTDSGFGELLVRAVKNEVRETPDTLDSAARTARLLEFMGKVLQSHHDLREQGTPQSGTPQSGTAQARETRSQGSRRKTRSGKEEAEDSEPSPAGSPEPATEEAPAHSKPESHKRFRPTLSFQALGGANEIGGSCHLLDFGTSRVLVDAGIKPDGRGSAAPDFKKLEGLDGAIITHAHLDHCGALPLLVRDQPDVPIYCTPPSEKLIINALGDHAAMGGGIPGGAPIREVQKRLVPMPFGKPFKVGEAKITLTESGHILGAASALLESGSAKVFHTGDICMEDHFSIPPAKLPEVRDIDLLIMEATLADRQPQPFSDSIRKMVETINETTQNREGTVLIPTYALGQAQEIILGLKHYGREYGLAPDAFIYVDGSVVTTSERLYAEQLGYMKPYLQHSDPKELFFSDNIRAVSNDDAARERILANPCAIIASPVTMQGGQSGFYRERLKNDSRNAVILPSNASSYEANHANGEEKWRVEKVSFAAHCTQDELLGIAQKLSPRQIILIHGSRRRISDLANHLAPEHKLHTPAVGETVRTIL